MNEASPTKPRQRYGGFSEGPFPRKALRRTTRSFLRKNQGFETFDFPRAEISITDPQRIQTSGPHTHINGEFSLDKKENNDKIGHPLSNFGHSGHFSPFAVPTLPRKFIYKPFYQIGRLYTTPRLDIIVLVVSSRKNVSSLCD